MKWRRKFQYNDKVLVGGREGQIKVALRKGQNNRVSQGWYVVWFCAGNQLTEARNVHVRDMVRV